MAIGEGKYDDVCTRVREELQAVGVVLIVMGGPKGNGFEVQFVHEHMLRYLPSVLRKTADSVERDLALLDRPP